jgi:DNA-binding CsgD family transcriptional regulator
LTLLGRGGVRSVPPVSLSTRIFVFSALLTVTMLLIVAGLLTFMGFFTVKVRENKKSMESELAGMARATEKQYGGIAAQALQLSSYLSENIERALAEKALLPTPDGLRQMSPGVLEDVLDAQYDTLFFSLDRARASGAFVVLNATVSQRSQEQKRFRAGLFFKNWEPALNSSSAILLLRGISRIGMRHKIVLDAQWTMEFDVEDARWFRLPQEAAWEASDSAPRLYYWQPAGNLKGTNYRGMLCSAPLVDSGGNVFGVCGFEVSDMLFKLSHVPDGKIFNDIFCVLAPVDTNSDVETFDLGSALFSWRYGANRESGSGYKLKVKGRKKGFSVYSRDDGEVFVGLHEPVSLYASGSPFGGQSYALAFLIPEADFDAAASADEGKLWSLSLLLLGAGALFSFVLSHWCARPILRGINAIRGAVESGEPGREPDYETVKIPEIDDLIEFLRSRSMAAPEERSPSEDPAPQSETEPDGTEPLTATEQEVLALYREGRTAKEIADALGVSVNTIKTHNRHIFMKLNVSSRRELLARVGERKK